MATIAVKVVPGARRTRIVGRYGDALKVQVAAPPERGKANEAVIALLAATLDLRPNQLALRQGHTQPRKVFEVTGIDQPSLDAKLDAAVAAAARQ
jgi:uncharacterized protein (TIGR00251 family)